VLAVYLSLIKKETDHDFVISEFVPSSTQATPVEYHNDQYGFTFSLPLSWQNYSIVTDKWTGQYIAIQEPAQEVIEGPKILIRHPDWTIEKPRQDIPIMIFTNKQWDLIQQEKIAVSAAPIGPKEIGHNFYYVFALPARYNFAYLTGYEEVEAILENNQDKIDSALSSYSGDNFEE
jgi:hypothetical protein